MIHNQMINTNYIIMVNDRKCNDVLRPIIEICFCHVDLGMAKSQMLRLSLFTSSFRHPFF